MGPPINRWSWSYVWCWCDSENKRDSFYGPAHSDHSQSKSVLFFHMQTILLMKAKPIISVQILGWECCSARISPIRIRRFYPIQPSTDGHNRDCYSLVIWQRYEGYIRGSDEILTNQRLTTAEISLDAETPCSVLKAFKQSIHPTEIQQTLGLSYQNTLSVCFRRRCLRFGIKYKKTQ